VLNATQRERVEYLVTELKTLAETTEANLGIAFVGDNDDNASATAAIVTNMTAKTAEAFEKNKIVGYIVYSAIRAIADGVEAKEKAERFMESIKGLSPAEMSAKVEEILGEEEHPNA